jgi:hypothetical protein
MVLMKVGQRAEQMDTQTAVMTGSSLVEQLVATKAVLMVGYWAVMLVASMVAEKAAQSAVLTVYQ